MQMLTLPLASRMRLFVQIEYRDGSRAEWQQLGGLEQVVASTRRYTASRTGLTGNRQYYFRITVLDRSRQEVHVSEALSVRTQCQPPSQPPSNIRIEAENSRSIYMQWTVCNVQARHRTNTSVATAARHLEL